MTQRARAGAAYLFANPIDADAVRCAIAWAGHLAPGFAVDFGDRTAGALRKEIELAMKCGHGDGDHIPQIFRDDINGNEVDFADGISTAPSAALDHITVVEEKAGRFDLHSPELVAGIEDEIVALAFSPGFGDAEAGGGSLGEKDGLGGFALGFASGEADSMKFGNVSGRNTS